MLQRLAKGFVLLAACAVAFTGVNAAAQSAVSGSISGTVTDPTGAVIANATVTLTNTDRGENIRVLKTSSAGFYSAATLASGHIYGHSHV